MNIFENAARKKLRFNSSVGMLTVEDLFDLPLTATGNRSSLDTVARAVHHELKEYSEVSFVEVKPNPKKENLELAMEIVKHVIEVKKEAVALAVAKTKREDQRRFLTEILAKKQNQALESLTEEEIQKKLAELAE